MTESEHPSMPRSARPSPSVGILFAALAAATVAWSPAEAGSETSGPAASQTDPITETRSQPNETSMTTANHPYVGLWVTADGHVRQELKADGRYDEARGTRKSAYQGRYEVRGNHIEYWDDTGFTADGLFVSPDELHHGGMIFHREK